MKNNLSTLSRLSTVIEQLKLQSQVIDKRNTANKAHKMIENESLFSLGIFVTDSDLFTPYVNETQKKLTTLSRLLNNDKADLATLAIEKIEQQIQALVTALHANKTMHDDAQVRLDNKISSIKARQYKQMAQTIMHSSQTLYQKLSEHHEFERRLQSMLNEQELKLNHCKPTENQEYAQKVLTLHQRLGRCRKAISIIERDIEFLEKR